MRREILQLLRCPRCRHSGLNSESDAEVHLFGPLRCTKCHASYPVTEGVADLVVEPPAFRAVQRGLEQRLVARSYERYVRPLLQRTLARTSFDRESEFVLYRSLLGRPPGPVLDLGTGTGLFARRLAAEPELPSVVGMDVSTAMLEEAMAQTREAGVKVDYVRAEAPYLPFLNGTLGGVLQSGSLHFIADLGRLLLEVARVLRPGGRFVASTYQPPGAPSALLHRKAGLHPRGEVELRAAVTAAGLVNFERVLLPPFILVKAERAAR
ncbi:methyltransferase domain-containing protein [Myxococcaceae bacterium GXIMD 01537]